MVALACLAACAAGPGTTLIDGGTVVGVGPADVLLRGARIEAVGDLEPPPGAEVVDASGRFVAPGPIDSHVHVVFYPEAEALAAGGVVAAVDLAAPEGSLATPAKALRVLAAGPMITSVAGYPTLSWGIGGYGTECADVPCATAAVDRLHGAGAGVIKVPVDGERGLSDDQLTAVVERTHALGLKVVAHALSDADARRAADAGVDALAHTPTETLTPETVAAWKGRAVISTLTAFPTNGRAEANLGELRAAGVTVLYGTDFGNTRILGVQEPELVALQTAGLSPADVQAALTSAPATYWGWSDLGAVEPGKTASIVLLSSDPATDATAWARPSAVWVAGERAL